MLRKTKTLIWWMDEKGKFFKTMRDFAKENEKLKAEIKILSGHAFKLKRMDSQRGTS